MPLRYDELPTAQAPQTQQIPTIPKTVSAPPPIHPVKRFLFVEIVAGEILLGAIVVGLIFGLLNYFNILSLKKSFPILAFLPAQKTAQLTTFAYDDKKAYEDLATFDKQQILDVYLVGEKNNQQNVNEFLQQWVSSDPKVFINQSTQFQVNTNNEIFYKIAIGSLDENIQTASPSGQAASDIFKHYTKNDIDPKAWDCSLGGTKCFYKKPNINEFTYDYRVFWSLDAKIVNVVICKTSIFVPSMLDRCVATN